MTGRSRWLAPAVVSAVLLASTALAYTQPDETQVQSLWLEAGLAGDSHSDPSDRNGFSDADARNDPAGMAAAMGLEFAIGKDMNPPRPLALVGWVLRPLIPGTVRLGVGLEYYPLAAQNRLAPGNAPGAVPVIERGAGGKLLLTAALSFRTRMASSAGYHPFVEYGLGYAGVRGDPRVDVDSVTGEVLAKDNGITGGGILVEGGFGVLKRRATHDLYACLRAQGYSDFITGGTSFQLVFGIATGGTAEAADDLDR